MGHLPQRSSEDARIRKTRAALHAALIDLIATQPLATVTVAAITKQAGVGYATFFRHYVDPQALLLEIAGTLIDELLMSIAPLVLAQDGLGAAHVLTAFVGGRRRLCHGLLVGAGDAMRREITARALDAARRTHTASPAGLPRDLGLIHGVAATLTILTWWLDQDAPAGDVAAIIDHLVFAPLKRPVPSITIEEMASTSRDPSA